MHYFKSMPIISHDKSILNYPIKNLLTITSKFAHLFISLIVKMRYVAYKCFLRCRRWSMGWFRVRWLVRESEIVVFSFNNPSSLNSPHNYDYEFNTFSKLFASLLEIFSEEPLEGIAPNLSCTYFPMLFVWCCLLFLWYES